MKTLPYTLIALVVLAVMSLASSGCGDDADALGVGATCSADGDCNQDDNQKCLTQFKGGYCGSVGCTASSGCPKGALCVTHTDGKNYCFRGCTDKAQCNENRAVDVQSNCSSSITFASGTKEGKACIPPSS